MKEILIIFKKEILGILRDKSTLIILIIAVLVFPIFNMGINYLNRDGKSEVDLCIQYDSVEAYKVFMQYISEEVNYDFKVINSKYPEKLLKEGSIDCCVKLNEKDFNFIYNSSSLDSFSTTTKICENFQRFYNSKLSEEYEDAFQLQIKDENDNFTNMTNSMSKILVPIILVMIIFQNTSGFANDIFAGEKERKTLELLFLSGVNKKSVYFGKALALLSLSMINLIVCLISYFISNEFINSGIQQLDFSQGKSIISNILSLILIMIILSVIAVFLSLSISMISSGMKNAQILNEIVLSVPVGITVLMTTGILKNNAVFRYVPIFNLITNLNNCFAGDTDWIGLIIMLITNSIVIGILLIASVKYMKTEKIIM
ncbi:MAG: ABC transporter permease [Clostridia bacterium]|nr:ABC transporter permease [Clostridia bacterium]